MIAFFLFSLILITYLPGYRLEVNKIQKMKLLEAQWHVFYDLVQMTFSQDESQNQMALRILAFETLYGEITFFNCNLDDCQITFDSGDTYQVNLLQVN